MPSTEPPELSERSHPDDAAEILLESLSLDGPAFEYPPRLPDVSSPDFQPPLPAVKLFDIAKTRRTYLKICAPMVRYSKVGFRELVLKWGVDLAYSPMIMADVFKNAEIARDCEFTTNPNDQPLVVQFAAKNAHDLAKASEIVAPYVNGVDLNCGCPQRWAIQEGIGSHLMEDPEMVRDMIRQTKSRCSPMFPCGIPMSIKIRIHPDLRRTVDYVQMMEKAGVDFITVHGRNRRQKSTVPVNVESIQLVKTSVAIPVVANGGIFSLEDADEMVSLTNVDGVMAARGLLQNPAMFQGLQHTPLQCLREFIKLGVGTGMNHFIFHHHLMYMTESIMSKQEKKSFNVLTSIPSVLDWLEEHYGMDFLL